MEMGSGKFVFKSQTAVTVDVTVARASSLTLRQLYQMVQGNKQGDAILFYLKCGTLMEVRTSQILKKRANHSTTVFDGSKIQKIY
jgi:hypothetical protein